MPNRSIRRWKAKGLTDRGANQMMFFNEEKGRKMSVAEYYQENYNCQCAHHALSPSTELPRLPIA